MGVYDVLIILFFAALVGFILYSLIKENEGWKPAVIALVIAAATLSLWYPERYGPSQQLRLGLDLAGGTTLIYNVQLPDHVINEGREDEVIDELIDVLRDRIDPQGVRNLVWRQVAGNRIEIQMALAPPETGQRREVYTQARDALVRANITEGDIAPVFQADSQAQREQAIAELAGGSAELRDRLWTLAEAYDAREQAIEQYRQVVGEDQRLRDRIDALEQELDELTAEIQAAEAPDDADAQPLDDADDAVDGDADTPDEEEADQPAADDEQATNEDDLAQRRAEIEQELDELYEVLDQLTDARRTYQQALSSVQQFNVQPAELDGLLDLDPEERQQRIEQLKQMHEHDPRRVEQLQELQQRADAYNQVRGPLDDYNDLITLLQGAGIIEYRVAVTGSPASYEGAYDSLAERGPRANPGAGLGWFRINDITSFVDQEHFEQFEQLGAREYFGLSQTRDLVVAEHAGRYYMLLYTTPERTLTRDVPHWELTSARPSTDRAGRPNVAFTLNPAGGREMGRLTSNNINEPMAILLDNQVVSAPTIQGEIRTRGEITGRFTQEDVTYLVRTLQAGSTEAELAPYPSSIQQIGPQLGQDNLWAGISAAVIALILVGLFIAAYYLFAGFVADFALVANIVIILGVMALFGGTFTLYGIAGLVLTVGMAVDANVLIFERIREELNRGVDLPTSVRLGYDKALSAILDANLTTLITCIVLYYFSTAEVRGFALVLGIGIIATLFTALFSTRVFLQLYVRYTKARDLPMVPRLIPAVDRLLSPNVDWIGKRKAFFTFSAIVLIGGLTLVGMQREEMLDIEFRSGTQVTFETAEEQWLGIDQVRDRLSDYASVAAMVQQDIAGDENFRAALSARFEPGDTIEPERRRTDLDAPQQSIYNELFPIILDSFQRRLDGVARGEPVDPFQNFTLVGDATVVTAGSTQREAGRTLAQQFNVATLVTDAAAISELVVASFGDVLDDELARPVRFANDNVENLDDAPIGIIDDGVLGENINRPAVGDDVTVHLGGVWVLLENLDPTTTLDDLERRIQRMAMHPQYEGLGFRDVEVFAVETADGDTLHSAAVVASDPQTNYMDTPEAFNDPDGLAATEWNRVRDALQQGTALSGVSNFSGQVSAAMQRQAISAMALALLAVVAYIWFRFGSPRYGIAAIIALVHDVGITVGLLALTGFLQPDAMFARLFMLEPFKIDLAIIAAILTIIGYSLNDTIVTFDRIRENRGRLSRETPGIINDSINQVFSRTVITSGTTLLAVGALYILGGPGVHGFAFTVLVGVLVGTYSSIGIAAQTLLLFPEKKPEFLTSTTPQKTRPTPPPAPAGG